MEIRQAWSSAGCKVPSAIDSPSFEPGADFEAVNAPLARANLSWLLSPGSLKEQHNLALAHRAVQLDVARVEPGLDADGPTLERMHRKALFLEAAFEVDSDRRRKSAAAVSPSLSRTA